MMTHRTILTVLERVLNLRRFTLDCVARDTILASLDAVRNIGRQGFHFQVTHAAHCLGGTFGVARWQYFQYFLIVASDTR